MLSIDFHCCCYAVCAAARSLYATAKFLVFFALQSEAKLLRGVQSGGSATKVITLGIGSNIIEWLLEAMASEPHDKNVVLVQGYSSLPLVEEQLANESCRGKNRACDQHLVRMAVFQLKTVV